MTEDSERVHRVSASQSLLQLGPLGQSALILDDECVTLEQQSSKSRTAMVALFISPMPIFGYPSVNVL